MDGKIFNHYHASAAYHSLAILERKHGLRNKEKTHPVWSRLARRVQEMVENDEVQPQTVANVLWSLGQLFSHRVTLPRNMICVCVFFGLGRGEESFCFQEQGLQQFCKNFRKLDFLNGVCFTNQLHCFQNAPLHFPEKKRTHQTDSPMACRAPLGGIRSLVFFEGEKPREHLTSIVLVV